jgi:hypothetical protein
VRTTPFTANPAFGEHVTLDFSLPGFEERKIELNKPTDLQVHLHLFPERAWKSSSKTEAAPVPSGDDHIVADRRGPSGAPRSGESHQVGGRAQDPGRHRPHAGVPAQQVGLAARRERGRSGLARAVAERRGRGPARHRLAARGRPELTRSGVSVQFADGRVAVWSDKLEPIFYQADSLVGGASPGRTWSRPT